MAALRDASDEESEQPGQTGLELSVDENNLLHQMWKKVKVEESFYANYE